MYSKYNNYNYVLKLKLMNIDLLRVQTFQKKIFTFTPNYELGGISPLVGIAWLKSGIPVPPLVLEEVL